MESGTVVVEIDGIDFEVSYDYEPEELPDASGPGADAQVILNSVIFHGCEFCDILSESTLERICRHIRDSHDEVVLGNYAMHVDLLIKQAKERGE